MADTARTISNLPGALTVISRLAGAAAIGLALLGAAPALADPAVSSPNGKITAFGGGHGDGIDDDGLGGIAGSYTMGLGTQFGAQVDGAWARVGDEDFVNTGLHLFWRDPSRALIGLYGGYAHLSDEGGIDAGRAGVELQYFLDRLTIDTAAGVRFGDIDTEGYVRAKLDYYVIDNLRLSGGYVHEELSFALTAVEYQFSAGTEAGASVFAEGRVHDEDRYTLMAGMKVYIGEQMSLINRHRRQDPEGYLDLDLIAAQAAAAAAARDNQSTGGGSGGSAVACPFPADAGASCDTRFFACDDNGITVGHPAFDACFCPAGC